MSDTTLVCRDLTKKAITKTSFLHVKKVFSGSSDKLKCVGHKRTKIEDREE